MPFPADLLCEGGAGGRVAPGVTGSDTGEPGGDAAVPFEGNDIGASGQLGRAGNRRSFSRESRVAQAAAAWRALVSAFGQFVGPRSFQFSFQGTSAPDRPPKLYRRHMFRIAAPLIKKSHTAAISMRLTFALALGCLTSRTLASLVAPALHRPALLQRPRVAAASVRCAEGDDDKSIVERLGLPVNLISEKSNPYVTSKADRMREKFGEKSVVGQSARSGGRAGVEDRLSEDIARFKAERGPDPSALTADDEPGFLMKTIDTLGTILTFNFGIICLFFTWFLVRPPADGPADALGREGRAAAGVLGVCVRRLR